MYFDMIKKEVNGIIWCDATAYAKDQEKIPTSFEARFGECEIYLTSAHIYYKGSWIFHCKELGFDTKLLKAKSMEDATIESVEICKQKVQGLYNSFFK